MSLETFGSEACPIRASSLPQLIQCPWQQVLLHLELTTNTSGAAADTGSAAHKAVDEWHKGGKRDVAACIETMHRLAPIEFPEADLARAEKLFRAYYLDDVNRSADIVLSETKIRCVLPPASFDPTSSPVVITGTLDQVRRINGLLAIVDLKSGKLHEGEAMTNEHAYQLAAYQLGASQLLGEPVHDAVICRLADYEKRTVGQVFYTCPWRFSDLNNILDGVRQTVALIRMGEVRIGPGAHCRWCPAGGQGRCLSLMKEMCQ